jgi:hypothetical protein
MYTPFSRNANERRVCMLSWSNEPLRGIYFTEIGNREERMLALTTVSPSVAVPSISSPG